MTRCTRTAQRATLRRTMLQHATRARTACAINTAEAPTRRRCKLHGWTHATCWRVSASHRVESSTIAQRTCRTRRIPGLAQLSVARCMHHAGSALGHIRAMPHAARRMLHRRTPTKVSSAARRRQASAYEHRWRRVEHRWRIDQRSCRRTETQRALQRRNMQDATRLDASTEACIPKRVRARAGALSFAKAPRRFTVHVARRALHGEPLRCLPAAFYMLQLRTAALPQPMRAVASAVPLTHSTDWPGLRECARLLRRTVAGRPSFVLWMFCVKPARTAWPRSIETHRACRGDAARRVALPRHVPRCMP
jgi:hypothetical protein